MKSVSLSVQQCQQQSFTQVESSKGGWGAMSQVFGGALLVAGTCIGAGMLGLPVSTAAGGFYWTTSFFLVCWAIMTITAFLMLEVSLWHKEDTNLISMAHETLGKWAEVVAWVTYLLFLYSIMAAYTQGGTAIAGKILNQFGVPYWLSSTFFILFFGYVVYLGARWVDYVNRTFMIGLVFAYVGLVSMGTSEVNINLFHDGQSKYLFAALPLMVTSFGFHLLIPTLKTYLNNDLKKLRLSIFLGSLLPLFVYVLWEFIILGVIPAKGDQGLIMMLQEGAPEIELTERLTEIVSSVQVGYFAKCFTFFALISSFIGVALGLFDFLADGLKINKSHKGRAILSILTFLPPVIFISITKNGFLIALTYAGIFAAILLVIFPALMAYVGRYHRDIKREYEVFGGRWLPLLAILFGCSVIVLHFLNQAKVLPVPSLS